MVSSGNIRFRGPLAVFVICLIISTSLWLVIRLSGIYTSGFCIRLKYLNIPEDKVLIEPGKAPVVINIRAQGFKILTLEYFQKPDPLIIDLSRIRFKHRNGQSYYDFPLSRFESLITEKYILNGEFLSFTPDTLYIVLEDKVKIDRPVH